MLRNDDKLDVDEYDREDASVRGDNDPPTRGRTLKALEREAELEFQRSEARNTGGVEHQSRDESSVSVLDGRRRPGSARR
jgi:hypothetical protein